jgi:hypothetical protein
MRFNRKKNRYVSLDGYDYINGSVEMKEENIYNPHKFPTTNAPF